VRREKNMYRRLLVLTNEKSWKNKIGKGKGSIKQEIANKFEV
jgi:hypothetical protein